MAKIERDPRDRSRWRVKYRDYTYDGANRRQPQTTKGGFATKAEAEAWVARMVVGKQDGSWVDPAAGRMSYAEWAQVGWRHRGLTCGRRPTTGMPTTSADM